MHNHLKIRARSLFWGTLLVLLGLTLLAVNFGYASEGVWGTLFSLWPLLLIVWGINVLARNTKFSQIAYLTPIILVAAFGYAFLNPQPDKNFPGFALGGKQIITLPKKEEQMQKIEYEFDASKVRKVNLFLDLAASQVRIASTEDDTQVKIDVETERGQPDVSSEVEDEVLRIMASSPSGNVPLQHGRERWRIAIPAGVELAIDLQGAVSASELDLKNLKLANLKFQGAVSTLELWLPNPTEGNSHVKIETAVSSMAIYLPKNAQARLVRELAAAAIDTADLELYRQDNTFYTKDFNYENPFIDIDLQAAVGKVRLGTWD